MRLLNARSLEVLEFLNKDVPPYVILSHTWEEDEVTFPEMQNGGGRSKKGFDKIQWCCSEALREGIEYVWVDTCCIDKTSSAELSEAINSMFRWYQDAVRCYAYLYDVSVDPGTGDTGTQLRDSRWFTRGWTLQELLAPKEVIFFDGSWTSMGNRGHWARTISEFTSIHDSALTGKVEDIRAFGVAQKFSWASRRCTTREEDMAYCMLGLFDVHMPLLYGEGPQAFIRIQEEIMKRSDDQTLFAWSPVDDTQQRGLLALHPSEFRKCTNLAPFRNWGLTQSYESTNAGIRLTSSFLVKEDSTSWLILQCYNHIQPERLLGIHLVKLSSVGDQFARVGALRYREGVGPKILPPQTFYVRNSVVRPEAHTLVETGKYIHFRISMMWKDKGWYVMDAFPPGQWDHERQLVKPPEIPSDTGHMSELPDPRLFNWSWHVVLSFCLPETRHRIPTEAPDPIFVVIGYNGRNDKCWCNMYAEHNLDIRRYWATTRYSGTSERWCYKSRLTQRGAMGVAIVRPNQEGVQQEITPVWDGTPLIAQISID